MEAIFIKQVYTLTAKILGNEIEFGTALEKLEGFLKHAKRLNMQRYESETLNTLGILYGTHGDFSKQMYYFQAAYEYSDGFDDDDFDFRIKITNNLGSSYLSAWQLREAKSVLEQGTRLIRDHKVNLLGSVYVYSNTIGLYILEGDFAQANESFSIAWDVAQKVQLKDYSRMEFFLIITALHHQKAQIDVAQGNCDAVIERLALADEQIVKTQRDDLQRDSDRVRLYHALVCEKDEVKAKSYEAALIGDAGGSLDASSALTSGFFFKNTQQQAWAERYANMVLTIQDDESPVLDTMRQHANNLIGA